MASRRAPRITFGVFVKFRTTRLALRRGITSVEEAHAFAAEVRANRFHDREAVFVVKEPGGTIVLPGLISLPVEESAPEPPESVVDLAAPSQASGRPRAGGRAVEVPQLLSLVERLDRVRRLSARATLARVRFERALAAAEGMLQRSADEVPEALRPHNARLRDLGRETQVAAEAFARSAAVIEKQLQRAYSDLASPPSERSV